MTLDIIMNPTLAPKRAVFCKIAKKEPYHKKSAVKIS